MTSILEAKDLVEIGRKEMLKRGVLDPRFTMTHFYWDFATDELLSCVQCRMENGKQAASMIKLDRGQLAVLSPEQLVEYLVEQVGLASASLAESVLNEEAYGLEP